MAYGKTINIEKGVTANIGGSDVFRHISIWVRFGASDITLTVPVVQAIELRDALNDKIDQIERYAEQAASAE